MLLPILAILSAGVVSAAGSSSPHRISYQSLFANNVDSDRDTTPHLQLLNMGLTKDGLISMTDIPNFKETKIALMSQLHSCIIGIDQYTNAGEIPTQHYNDGTIRRSFALSKSTTLDDFEEALLSHNYKLDESCQSFIHHLASFRSIVDATTLEFAKRLSVEMGTSLPKPLLKSIATTPSSHSNNNGSDDYEGIQQIVEGGDYLEHFHSYQKIKGEDEDETTTIEFHTDQGFFIVFTPGLIVGSESKLELSDGFYIQDVNGNKIMMEFDADDDLVFMMGDGVNQM